MITLGFAQVRIVDVLKYWIPLAALATVLFVLAYVLVQQDIRLSANDPEIQMAEDAASALVNGKAPQSLMTADKVDIARSLAPYLIVFDDKGQPIASSAHLDGQTPIPPDGVFHYTKEHGQDRFTWQPRAGVRSAAVLTYYKGTSSGFVLAGRSMREIENRESQIELLAILAWLVGLGVTLVAVVFFVGITSRYGGQQG